MPVLESDFDPSFLFRNRHVSTMYPNVLRFIKTVPYERERLEFDDGDFVDLDHARVGSDRLVLILHGLEGNSRRNYAKGIVKAVNGHGFDACVFNQRGCSGEPNRLWTSYHSGKSDDLRKVIDHLAMEDRYSSLHLVGVSLGGNIMLKYLGEEESSVRSIIKSATAVSVPTDLYDSAVSMKRSENRIYLSRLLKSLKRKLLQKIDQFPGCGVTTQQVDQCMDFITYDDLYTAPAHGFDDAVDYYARCSSSGFLDRINIPTLIISAQNDPFFTAKCIPYEIASSSDLLYLIAPRYGGHVGFTAGAGLCQKSWMEEKMVRFIVEQQAES